MTLVKENSWEVIPLSESSSNWGIRTATLKGSIEQGCIRTESLPHPTCQLYNPLSITEGKCYDGSIVNYEGCQNPESCDRHKKILRGDKND